MGGDAVLAEQLKSRADVVVGLLSVVQAISNSTDNRCMKFFQLDIQVRHLSLVQSSVTSMSCKYAVQNSGLINEL